MDKAFKKRISLCVGLLCALAPCAAHAEKLSIRILEKLHPRAMAVDSHDSREKYILVLDKGKLKVNQEERDRFTLRGNSSVLTLRCGGLVREYPGGLEVFPDAERGELCVINRVDADAWAACAAAAETRGLGSPPEFCTAQAVTIFSFGCHQRGRRHQDWDFCDLTHCLLYQGLPPDFEAWQKNLARGKGCVLWKDVEDAPVFFSRCCGGLLDSADNIWKQGEDAARECMVKGRTLCRADPLFTWTRRLRAGEISRTLRDLKLSRRGEKVTGLRVLSRTPGKRARLLEVALAGRIVPVDYERFKSAYGKRFGWNIFLSAAFEIEKQGNWYALHGKGFGHGVGLCQSGAVELAKMGWNWKEILDFYFPGGLDR